MYTLSLLNKCAERLCVFLHMCAHVQSPADSLLCVSQRDRFTLQSLPVDVRGRGGQKDKYQYCHGNCRPAVPGDPQCHNAKRVCVCV